MEAQQNTTSGQITTATQPPDLSSLDSIDKLSERQLQWVDYCVVQGLITADDGEPQKMTVTQFARSIGVDRTTLYNWKKIPRFWEYVAMRRKVIFSQTRTQKVWNSLYMAATSKLDVRAIQTWLANADTEFRMPSQTVQHEAGDSMSELILQIRARKQNQIVEGEIVDNAANPNNG